MYLAHISEDGERKQTVLEHLQCTACLAGIFAESFHHYDWGYACGILHDVGKYSSAFQARLLGGAKVDHATAGAKEIYNHNMLIANCIAGHHTGLLNPGDKSSGGGEATFYDRMNKTLCDYHDYKNEIELPQFSSLHIHCFARGGFSKSFFTRMLFSCLVDADYLDTERFMSDNKIDRNNYDSMSSMYDNLKNHVNDWLKNDDKLTIAGRRTQILKSCFEKGKEEQGIFQLTVPTGGGKTISSLAFALEHAKKHNLDRIIYVVPYTSIIEQNAEVFRNIVGKKNVLEHHYNVEYDNDIDLKANQLATENWDMPIIVTTNVQFFESLFANKPSKCRKLHNIANSVIIFDEAQMLPIKYLKPCIWAMNEIVTNYQSSIVLCTATQPALKPLFDEIRTKSRIKERCKFTELCPDPEDMYQFFKRTHVEYIGDISISNLVDEINQHKQVLCILNNRKQVQMLFHKIKGEAVFHLSTTMYPKHRKRILEKIKSKILRHEPCIVISTSLIEAGVDLDFEYVYREIAGLDSIIQAAGRCNREGRHDALASKTIVFSFDKNSNYKIHDTLKLPISCTKLIVDEFDDITSLDAISVYFKRLYHSRGDTLDSETIIKEVESYLGDCFPFKMIAEKFKIIEEHQVSIVIDIEDEAKQLIEKLKKGIYTKSIMRDLGLYTVHIFQSDFEALSATGLLAPLSEDLYSLRNCGEQYENSQYDNKEGLRLDFHIGDASFL